MINHNLLLNRVNKEWALQTQLYQVEFNVLLVYGNNGASVFTEALRKEHSTYRELVSSQFKILMNIKNDIHNDCSDTINVNVELYLNNLVKQYELFISLLNSQIYCMKDSKSLENLEMIFEEALSTNFFPVKKDALLSGYTSIAQNGLFSTNNSNASLSAAASKDSIKREDKSISFS